MKKAKSRLVRQKAEGRSPSFAKASEDKQKPEDKSHERRKSRIACPERSRGENRVLRYLKHSPTLILGLLSLAILYYLLSNFYPEQVKNILVANSYLPILLSFFFSGFFLFSFIFLHSRRGFLLSLFLTTILFLQIHSHMYWQLYLYLAIIFILPELIMSFFDRK